MSIDHTDRLPDPVLLSILSLISDVKSLGRCSAVSRRFHSLIPLVDKILVRIDLVLPDLPLPAKPPSFLSLLSRLLLKPLRSLARPNSASIVYEASHHSPTEVLRNFREIKQLRIELPAGELGIDDGAFLKWKANFGSSLDSCVILCAEEVNSVTTAVNSVTNYVSGDDVTVNSVCGDASGIIPESFYRNGNLRMRVVWTISSLIAASARHFLLGSIAAEHEMLESLELGDADGQGVLWMDGRQLRELRSRPVLASGSLQRTLVPAVSMRLWYAERLELLDEVVMKGATLLAIRPRDEIGGIDGSKSFESCCMLNEFEEPYKTAVKMLVKRRNYTLEMNSF